MQTLLREKIVQVIDVDRGNRVKVAEVEGDLIVKYGTDVRAGETIAMHVVAAQTSIPVPEVISIVEDGEMTYIVQRQLSGVRLSEIIDNLDKTTGLRIVEQLRYILAQLSDVTPLEEGKQLANLGKPQIEREDETGQVVVGDLVGLPEWTGCVFAVFQPTRLTSPPKFLGTTTDLPSYRRSVACAPKKFKSTCHISMLVDLSCSVMAIFVQRIYLYMKVPCQESSLGNRWLVPVLLDCVVRRFHGELYLSQDLV